MKHGAVLAQPRKLEHSVGLLHMSAFGPATRACTPAAVTACCLQVSVLDYQSTQLKLLPILATAYCLHFTKDHLVRVSRVCMGGLGFGGVGWATRHSRAHCLSAGTLSVIPKTPHGQTLKPAAKPVNALVLPAVVPVL